MVRRAAWHDGAGGCKGGYNGGMDAIPFSQAECMALYELIDQLSGGSPENVFRWDGTDDATNPTASACAKVFRAAGRAVPASLEGAA